MHIPDFVASIRDLNYFVNSTETMEASSAFQVGMVQEKKE